MRINDVINASKRRNNKEEFKSFDRSSLSDMDDRSLAEWQAEYNMGDPQWRIAEHEWQRRITAESIAATIKAARGQAWFGIAGVIMGSLLTLLLTLLVQWLLT